MQKGWYIGTSGWSYKNWDQKFYPKNVKGEEKLAHYSNHFNGVEINASFYRDIQPATYQKWKANVPESFAFAVKLNRYLTQMKKLKIDDQSRQRLDTFFEGVHNLGANLGAILIQLPPSFKKNIERMEAFLEQLPKGYRYAVEFRNDSWFDKETESLLSRYNTAFVISDSPEWPLHITNTADFLYMRFHGKEKLFVSQYKNEDLQDWAKTIKPFKDKPGNGYIFFNNTDKGYAIGNAEKIRQLIIE